MHDRKTQKNNTQEKTISTNSRFLAQRKMQEKYFIDNRPTAIAQRKMQQIITNNQTLNPISNIGSAPVQCEFAERVGAYMVLVKDSALRHLSEENMKTVIADPRFIEAINSLYAGEQIDRYTFTVGRVNLVVNIYPVGTRPPVVEVFHADAGYTEENKQKARDRWNSLYGKKGSSGGSSGFSGRPVVGFGM